jgi:hypothetical protein
MESARQTGDEIHRNVLPFPRWNRKRLKSSSWLEMFGLHPLTSITFSYIMSHFSFHVRPPKFLPHILIHLVASGMD